MYEGRTDATTHARACPRHSTLALLLPAPETHPEIVPHLCRLPMHGVPEQLHSKTGMASMLMDSIRLKTALAEQKCWMASGVAR